MHHINIISTATVMTTKGGPKPDKMLFSCIQHLTHAMLPLLPCKLCIIHHGMIVCLSHFIHMLVHFIYVGLACLVFLRIDTEQGIYQETQEHYPDPSLATTELPGKHYHMLAYIQYLLPLSYSCIIESRLH